MKRQNKLNIKVRDLEPLKDVRAGRRHGARGRAGAFFDRGDRGLLGEYRGGLGFGHREIP